MICSKCGQELKEGARFCTKCGTSFKETINLAPGNLTLPIISIVLTVIGIIGYLVIQVLLNMREYRAIYFVFQNISLILLCFGIIVALISLNKQKSLIGFIVGIIPCVFLILIQVYYIIMNLKYN